MSSVILNSDTIDDSISICNDLIEMLSALQSDLQSKYRGLGSDWKDAKYQQLGDIVNECSSSIRKTLDELRHCLKPLRDIKKVINDYETTNLVGNNSIDGNISGITQVSISGIFGGSYRDCKIFSAGAGNSEEVHHIPAASISRLNYCDGPAVTMSRSDHQQTASYDSKRGSREFRERQHYLINQGRFAEAIQMDIDDMRDKFGNKYDNGINSALEYVRKLVSEGRV